MALVLLLAGCTGPMGANDLVSDKPHIWKFRHTPQVVQKAAAQTLEKKGFKIKVNDPEEGLVETDYLSLRRIRDRVIMKFRKVEHGYTEVTCLIEREKKELFGDEWEPGQKVEPELYRDLKPDLEYFIYRTLYEKY